MARFFFFFSPKLTFAPVIFDHESLGSGLPNPYFPGSPLHDPSPQPEFPAPYPLGVVREDNIGEETDPLGQRHGELTRHQRPPALAFALDAVVELLLRPVLLIVDTKVPVEGHNLDPDGREWAGVDNGLGDGVQEDNLEHAGRVLGLDSVPGEDGGGDLVDEAQLQAAPSSRRARLVV